MARFGRKRLSVDVPIELHIRLMEIAKKYNITLTRLLLRIFLERLHLESKVE